MRASRPAVIAFCWSATVKCRLPTHIEVSLTAATRKMPSRRSWFLAEAKLPVETLDAAPEPDDADRCVSRAKRARPRTRLTDEEVDALRTTCANSDLRGIERLSVGLNTSDCGGTLPGVQVLPRALSSSGCPTGKRHRRVFVAVGLDQVEPRPFFGEVLLRHMTHWRHATRLITCVGAKGLEPLTPSL